MAAASVPAATPAVACTNKVSSSRPLCGDTFVETPAFFHQHFIDTIRQSLVRTAFTCSRCFTTSIGVIKHHSPQWRTLQKLHEPLSSWDFLQRVVSCKTRITRSTQHGLDQRLMPRYRPPSPSSFMMKLKDCLREMDGLLHEEERTCMRVLIEGVHREHGHMLDRTSNGAGDHELPELEAVVYWWGDQDFIWVEF